MKHQRSAIGTAALLAAGSVVITAPAAQAVDECLGTPRFGDINEPGEIPDLAATDGTVRMFIRYSVDSPPDYCSGVSATVQKADGSLRRVVPFNGRDGTGMPPSLAVVAEIPIPRANGAGDWVVIELTHGTETRMLSVPFRVRRASTATIEQPATVTSPTRTTITGVVRQYTSTGVQVISPYRVVRLYGAGAQSQRPYPQLGTTKTDAHGRYRFQLAISSPAVFQTTVDKTDGYGTASTDPVTARFNAQLSALTASDRAYIGVWWRVGGKAFPASTVTTLERLGDSGWSWTQSFGNPAADGTFTRWWKPTTAGTYRLRVSLVGTGPENLPLIREVDPVTVTARPTTLTGTAGATNATVIRPGTKMSTFGRLSAMFTTGTTGPFANQHVVVQTRPRGDTTEPYTTVATATTTSTGYYYTNWNAQQDVDVRVAYLSPYQSVGSAFRYVRAVEVG